MLLALAFLLPWAAGAHTCRAQPLPDTVTTAPAPDEAALDAFINSKFPGSAMTLREALAKVDSAARARKLLAEPVQRSSPRCSPGFRNAYSKKLNADLTKLAKDPSDDVAVNALRLAGLIGAKEGLELLEDALNDPREAVRVAAATGIDAAIGTAQREENAFLGTSRPVTDALDKLNAAMAKEKAPRVLEAMVLALDSALRVPEKILGGVRARAMDILLAQSARLVRSKDTRAAELDALFGHIAKGLSDALSNQNEKVTDAQRNEAAGIAGEIIVRIYRRLDAEVTEAQRTELAIVADQADLVIKYAGAVKNYTFGNLIRTSKDAEFKDAASKLFTDLAGPPFNLDPKRFDPKQP